MSLLSELKTIMGGLNIPCETGVFKGTAPSEYVVFVPLTDDLFCADDAPTDEVNTVRIVLYSKGNYLTTAKKICRQCVADEIVITARNYITHEDDTGYHQYAIDVQKNYEWEETTNGTDRTS